MKTDLISQKGELYLEHEMSITHSN